MPIEIHLEKKPYGLVPLTAADEEELATFPDGANLKARITKSKSRPMLRLYWAVVAEVAEGIGDMDKTGLSNQLLCKTRRFEGIAIKGSEPVFILRRISKMDWRELRDFVTAALSIIFEFYVDPVNKPAVMKVAERRAQTTYEAALRDLEREERKQ